MALDLRTSPYYDDFDVEKNFHRILFKPGYAVQARELTQAQTLLQEQIKRFGDNIFKDGTVILGCDGTFNFNIPFVKIENFNALDIEYSDEDYAGFKTSLVGKTITNEIGVSALIVKVEQTESQRILYLNYQTADSNSGGDILFDDSQVLSVTVGSTTFTFKAISSASTGTGSVFTLGPGIVYANGNFVKSNEQTIIVDYTSSSPTKNVGYVITDEIVTSDDDVTLLDPAAGSYNYAAPGADRYKLATELVVYDTTETPAAGFYLLFKVVDGQVQRAFNKTEYAELQKTLARRTYDESGNYSVNGLNVNIREQLKTSTNNGFSETGEASNLVYGVEPGRAYVEGFEIDLKSTLYLDVNKATDTGFFDEKKINTTFGNYVLVTLGNSAWNIEQNPAVSLQTSGSVEIATARVRLLKWSTGTTYKLYLYDIVPSGSYTTDDYQNITKVVYGSSAVATVLGTFTLENTTYNSYVFPTTAKAVVKFTDDQTDYFYWKRLPASVDLSPSGQITLGTAGETFKATTGTIKETLLVINDTTKQVVNLSSITVTSNTDITLTAGSSQGLCTVYALVSANQTNEVDVSLSAGFLKVDGAVSFSGTGLTNYNAGKIYLGVSNVLDVKSIVVKDTEPGNATDGTDITSDFILVQNQNDNYYNTSYLQYIGSNWSSIKGKHFAIAYRYFSRTSSAGYLTRNSYESCLADYDPTDVQPLTDGTIYSYQLPTFKSQTTGITYDLRDVVDFRPQIANRVGYASATYNTAVTLGASHNVPNTTLFASQGINVPDPDELFTCSFTYNLPRIDKVIATRDGDFKIVKGISSLVPQEPANQVGAMTLATVNLAPYPSLSTFVAKQIGREDYASYVRLVDNRRYTMHDIGEIEERVSRLEYFAALTMLESKTNSMFIPDSTDPTQNMIKKGILVDGFEGHGVGNIFDSEYSAAIDTKNKTLRPSFTLQNIELEVDSDSNANQIGDLIVMDDVGSSVLISNNYKTKTRTCGNPLLGNFMNGILTLNTPQDMWLDTNVRPDVQTNFQGNNDGWEYDDQPYTLHWNAWKTIWQGIEISTVATVNVATVGGLVGTRSYNESAQFVSDITRAMVVTTQLPDSAMRRVGLRVFDISIVPFVREQVVTFVAEGLKPNSIVTVKFDDEDVSEYCRMFTLPTNVSLDDIKQQVNSEILSQYDSCAGLVGDTLIVNELGQLVGQFIIPANTFRTGTRILKVTDAENTTQAAAKFTASGLPNTTDGDIISTRIPEVRADSLTKTQNTAITRITMSNPSTWSPSSYGDPLAQTFIIENQPNGVFVTSVDLFFSKKSASKGITVQIRDVVNGYPGEKIVPFSTVTLSHQDVSETGATTFTFDSPVYLKNNTEYALVVIPESNTTDYALWVSELGKQVSGSTEIVTQQPYVGVLFVPNNNTTWTALEAEDLRFTLHTGKFSTSKKTLIFNAAPVDYVEFTSEGPHTLQAGDLVKVYDGGRSLMTGTISVSGTAVTGTSTNFNQLSIGDRIRTELVNTPDFTLSIQSVSTLEKWCVCNIRSSLIEGDILYSGTDMIGVVDYITSDKVYLKENATISDSNVGTPKVIKIIGIVSDISSTTSLTLEEASSISLSNYNYYKDTTSAEGAIKTVTDSEAEIYITSGTLSEGDTFDIRKRVTGDTDKTSVTINSIIDKPITGLSPNIGTLTLAPSTDIVWSYRLRNAGEVQQTSYTQFKNVETLELDAPYKLFSYSNIGAPALELKAELTTNNSALTPVIDTRKVTLLTINNSETSTYITRAVDLDGANDLRVFMDIKYPEQTEITVSAKLQKKDNDGLFSDVSWVDMVPSEPLTKNRLEYQEYSFNMPDTWDPANDTFKKFAVRIIISTSADTSKVPTIKNFRAVALI